MPQCKVRVYAQVQGVRPNDHNPIIDSTDFSSFTCLQLSAPCSPRLQHIGVSPGEGRYGAVNTFPLAYLPRVSRLLLEKATANEPVWRIPPFLPVFSPLSSAARSHVDQTGLYIIM